MATATEENHSAPQDIFAHQLINNGGRIVADTTVHSGIAYECPPPFGGEIDDTAIFIRLLFQEQIENSALLGIDDKLSSDLQASKPTYGISQIITFVAKYCRIISWKETITS